MSRTGLSLNSVKTVLGQYSGRPVQESDIAAAVCCTIRPGRWKPYLQLVSESYTSCKLAILNVIWPSDIWHELLQIAPQDNLCNYESLCQAISNCADSH